ncbi:MAG: hypothetical protein FD143_1260 [Ignavibacteria bacterium]|nr:MAG: hypothetical protein FD143_1260 [Ignavibacteria bacterium]KAF0160777.1 MAG: hypothetical protein FD188_1382 [Ignavibacteria bacterium]
MKEEEIYPSLIEKLHKDFSLEKENLPAIDNLEVIRKHLVIKVKELMSRDYDRFLNSLYRIDVNEKKVREILHSKDRTTIPEQLADLIIDRQMMRVKTQLLYKQSKQR